MTATSCCAPVREEGRPGLARCGPNCPCRIVVRHAPLSRRAVRDLTDRQFAAHAGAFSVRLGHFVVLSITGIHARCAAAPPGPVTRSPNGGYLGIWSSSTRTSPGTPRKAKRTPLGDLIGPSCSLAPSFSSRAMSASMSSDSMAKCSRPQCALASPGPSFSLVRALEMDTTMPPSPLVQRMKRSPNTRVSSLTILKANAFSYHSAALRGSGDLMWMWLIRNGIGLSPDNVRLCGLPSPCGGRPRWSMRRAHGRSKRKVARGLRPCQVAGEDPHHLLDRRGARGRVGADMGLAALGRGEAPAHAHSHVGRIEAVIGPRILDEPEAR